MSVKSLQDLLSQHERKRSSQGKWEWLKELKNDGDTVTARLLTKGIIGTDDAGQSMYDFDVHEVHKLKVDGFDRYIVCRQDDCPLCHTGNVSFLRIWIPLQLADGTKKVWARGKREILQLMELTEQYGDLTQYLWEIKRQGDRGCADTCYALTPRPLPPDFPAPLPARPYDRQYVLHLTGSEMIQAVAGTLILSKGSHPDTVSSKRSCACQSDKP